MGGRWDSGVGGVGGGKISFRAAVMPIGAHTMVRATSVGDRDIQSVVGAILGPHYLISALHWCHCLSHVIGGSAKCPPGKHSS